MSGGIQKFMMMDMSYDMIKYCRDAEANVSDDSIETSFVVGDEEYLPIKERYTFFPFLFVRLLKQCIPFQHLLEPSYGEIKYIQRCICVLCIQ